MTYLDGITDSMHMSLSKLWDVVEDRESRCAAVPLSIIKILIAKLWLLEPVSSPGEWATTS